MADGHEMTLLLDAFHSFQKASGSLEMYYRGLEKKVEELDLALAEKNNYLTGILEGLPVGIIVTGSGGFIETINNAACSILGESAESLLGTVPRRELINMHCSLQECNVTEYEGSIIGRDGIKKILSVNITALKDLNDNGTGYLISFKDISEIKKLRESAQRDKRLMAMGEMAASIAHQIRNPLGSMELFASLLDEELAGDAEKQRISREIIHSVRTLNNTLSNMLLFANTSRPVKHLKSIRELLGETLEMCRFLNQAGNVKIQISGDKDDVHIYADKDLCRQALVNLVMNGIDALHGIEGGVVQFDYVVNKGMVIITVSDNGCGICERDIEMVFDPFFTRKASGTGLGLTVVNNIIKAHGGFIGVESSTVGGTIFSIYLPEGDQGHA